MSSSKISISDAFDGGNIKLMAEHENQRDPSMTDVALYIKPDVYTELERMAHMQYFCFRVTISEPKKLKFLIDNAEDVSYPEAWAGTTVCYSDDFQDVDSWKRVIDTFYTQGKLHWEFECPAGSTYFSFFPPFPYLRHLSLISKCARSGRCTITSLGQTLQGREMECIHLGSGERIAWIIHRQHPGETMAEHYAEGLLTRLLRLDGDELDEQVDRILKLYTFYIVPCMCPDGAVMGHLRTNSAGANLNREWAPKGNYQAPTLERSPEVYCVLNKMDETGVDLFLDVHGDEELPYNFISGADLIPKWGPRLKALHGAFVASYTRSNSDMQQKIGYPPPESAADVLKYMNVATNQVSNRFDCLGMTLEMPYKDCRSNPDPELGWTPARSRKLGASVLDPLEYVHPYLRAPGEFWNDLPPEDAHVVTTDDYQNLEGSSGFEFKMLHRRFYSDVHEFRKTDA